MRSRPLMTLRLSTAPVQNIGAGPHGTRLTFPITGGSFDGDRLRGKVLSGGDDWVVKRADGVLELDLRIGAYHQGARKFLTVMVKDSKKYASTGGWGFQAWPGGDPTKPIVDDAQKTCFTCHVPEKANDYVFSTYLQSWSALRTSISASRSKRR